MQSTSEIDDEALSPFRARRARMIEKRHQQKEANTALLKTGGVEFIVHNDGQHLVIGGRWDYFPSTDRWSERKGRPGKPLRKGRGVSQLLDIIAREAA